MKIFKRNAVIITVLLFVCAAVYLNWSYNKQVEDAAAAGDPGEGVDTMDESGTPETDPAVITPGNKTDVTYTGAGIEDDAGLFYTVTAAETEPENTVNSQYDEYFAKVRLDRQQARDEASATLATVAAASGASQETIDGALRSMARIAEWTAKEAELENLIRAKGFIDCVVYLSESGVSVTVASDEELTGVSVAKITDVIVSETDYTVNQLKVIPVS